MKIDSGLKVYDDNLISEEHKQIYKIAIIIYIILLAVSIILTVIFPHLYSIIIGYGISGIASMILFYITSKFINNSHYLDLKKATKRIHIIHQVVYLVLLALFLVIFKNAFVIISSVLGFILVKISIFISNIISKK